MCVDSFTDDSRRLLFRVMCVPIRLIIATLLVYLSYLDEKNNTDDSKLGIQIYLFTTAFFFTVQLIRSKLGLKKKGGFGGVMWWSNVRYVHIFLYTVSGLFVTLDVPYGGSVLYIDVLIGVVTASKYQP